MKDTLLGGQESLPAGSWLGNPFPSAMARFRHGEPNARSRIRGQQLSMAKARALPTRCKLREANYAEIIFVTVSLGSMEIFRLLLWIHYLHEMAWKAR